ncbi:MAG: YncE family protein [Chitinivibrionales bacterium]
MICKAKFVVVFGLGTLLLFIGCDDPVSSNGSPDITRSIVSVNTSSDYSEGNTALYDIENDSAYTNLLSLDSDNGIKTYNGSIYILQKTQNTVIKITGSNISPTTVDNEENVGDATNIHDIAFISNTKAYITQYDATDVVIYNPATGEKTGETVDLASYCPEESGTPNMDAAVYYGGNVYIGLQKLDDSYDATDNSSVVVIDAQTDDVTEEIILDEKNPQGMSLYGDKLYIACTGGYGVQDGGIEVIDLSSNQTEGVLVTEEELEGDVSDVFIFDDTRGYAVVAGANWSNSVICFDPSDGSIIETLSSVDNAAMAGLASDGTYLYVADRSSETPGLLIFDPDDNSLVSGPHDLGMPPNAIAYLDTEE